MNKQQLQYLTAIYESGSIRYAAAKTKKSPTTLGRMLKTIEEELELSLFWHTAEGLSPTPEGLILKKDIAAILEQFEALDSWAPAGRAHNWTENELRYLLTIRRRRNLSKAAEELFVTQPSLSQLTRAVNAAYGQPVFQRTHGGVLETDFGTALLDRLERLNQSFEQLHLDHVELQENKRGMLSFGIPSNLGAFLLPHVLPEFHRNYPGIDIRIREAASSELENLLHMHKIEFCIRHGRPSDLSSEFDTAFEDPFYLLIPDAMKTHFSFPEGRTLLADDLKKLNGEPFIMLSRRQALRSVVDDILAAAQVRPHVLCKSRNMETVKRLVAAGMGVTFLPESDLNLYSGTEGLIRYPLDASLFSGWHLVISCTDKNSLSGISRAFLKLVMHKLNDLRQAHLLPAAETETNTESL